MLIRVFCLVGGTFLVFLAGCLDPDAPGPDLTDIPNTPSKAKEFIERRAREMEPDYQERVALNSNLRRIILGVVKYETIHRTMPKQAIYSDDGTPLLSWRVAILPSLGEGELFGKFRLDEPWDSPHNIKLLKEMPDCYRGPFLGSDTKTPFQGVVDAGNESTTAMVKHEHSAIGLRDFRDGTANTIMLIQSDKDSAVEWTKPKDLMLEPDQPLKGIGNDRSFFGVVSVSGAPMLFPSDVDPDLLRLYLMRNDGEALPTKMPSYSTSKK